VKGWGWVGAAPNETSKDWGAEGKALPRKKLQMAEFWTIFLYLRILSILGYYRFMYSFEWKTIIKRNQFHAWGLIIYDFTSRWRIYHLYEDVDHHISRWRAAKFRPMLGAQGLCLSCTPAVTRDLGFSGLIRRSAPFSRLLLHTRGCGGSILTRILTVTCMRKIIPLFWDEIINFYTFLDSTIHIRTEVLTSSYRTVCRDPKGLTVRQQLPRPRGKISRYMYEQVNYNNKLYKY
jgi:hypothetical protein